MPEYRLGDVIDDFCVRCKRVMNHNVVSVLNGEPAKVRCRTCHSDHDYRHEQAPPPKVDARKQALFDQVLKKVDPGADSAVDAAVEAVVDAAEPLGEAEPVEAAAEAPEAAAEAAEPMESAAAAEAPKAKAAKAKGKARK